MSRYLVLTEDGTVMSLDDCYLVRSEDLSDEEIQSIENGFESEIGSVAVSKGAPLNVMLASSGFGDLHYGNAIAYSPRSLRDDAASWVSSYPEGSAEHEALRWAATASNDDLDIIGQRILAGDPPWDNYRSSVVDELVENWKGIQSPDTVL